MPKKILQDIVKTKNIPIKIIKNSENPIKKEIIHKEIQKFNSSKEINTEFASKYDSFSEKREKNSSRYLLWIVALVSIFFLFFAISFLFSNAKVTIDPKTEDFLLNKVFIAKEKPSTENLTFNSVILSDEESKEIQAGEEKDYLEYAKGSVLIYNAFNSSPQKLLVDTRLEGSNGKIYKTKTKTTIPGMDQNGLPGKVSVEIYGEEPGEEYNSTPLDFKILGFKDSPKYSKFYARSVGEITGGLKGKSRKVSDADKEKAIKELTESISLKLFQKAREQTPKDFILFNGANFVNIDEEKITSVSENGNTTFSIKGTFYGFLFNEKELTKKIVNLALAEEDKSDVYISNISDLKFSFENKNEIFLTDVSDITFNLSGNAKIVWKVDSNKIISDLLGKNKKDFNQALSQYTNIDSATSIVRPIWKRSFPEKEKDIKVIINYPE